MRHRPPRFKRPYKQGICGRRDGPAAGQGAIAAVIRAEDKFKFSFDLAKKDVQYTCCILEREFIRDLGGCKKPVGAYCEYKGNDNEEIYDSDKGKNNDNNNKRYTLTGLIYRNKKRLIPLFSGDEKTILKEIISWKAKHIL